MVILILHVRAVKAQSGKFAQTYSLARAFALQLSHLEQSIIEFPINLFWMPVSCKNYVTLSFKAECDK